MGCGSLTQPGLLWMSWEGLGIPACSWLLALNLSQGSQPSPSCGREGCSWLWRSGLPTQSRECDGRKARSGCALPQGETPGGHVGAGAAPYAGLALQG